MAYLEGESLEDRIAEGPLPLKDALEIGRQIAEGLEAAHEKGVVHRDIKPANVMVDGKGRATILDFGLARLTEASKLTRQVQTVGTAAYMSPEQIQGGEVDHRTDVWALGCVLYEMVAGVRPFKGQYDQALAYEILNQEPEPLTGVRAGVPMELEFMVGKCLAKDAADRYQSAKEIAVDIRTLAEKLKSGRSTILRTTQATGALPGQRPQTLNPAEALPPDSIVVGKQKLRGVYGLAAAFAVAFFGLLGLYLTQRPPAAPEHLTRRFSFSQEGLTKAAISPDGRYIAFVADTNGQSSVWLRGISSETARELPGTDGARPSLAWSPDSQSLVFATTTQLKRITVDGGDALTLGDLPATGPGGLDGISWSPDGERIALSSRGQLYEIPARGGALQLLLDRDEGLLSSPCYLPLGGGSQTVLYQTGEFDNKRISILNLETGERREIAPGGEPVYSRDGYLIHSSATTEDGLFALPFSLSSLEATGESFPIAEDGVGPSLTREGMLVYLDGLEPRLQTLVWRDRAGEVLERIGQPQPDMRAPSLSPDEGRVAVSSAESGGNDIWVHDLTRSATTRLTSDPLTERGAAWSPSGGEIAFARMSPDGFILLRVAADGTGTPVALSAGEWPDWSRDGRFLLFNEAQAGATRRTVDLRYFELQADGRMSEPLKFLDTPQRELAPKLSPDGRFVAYQSDESGRVEVYVRPFPDGTGKWQASVNGGAEPRWRSDGKELYYLTGSTLMSVSVSTGQDLTLGQPQALFESTDLSGLAGYDVSRDGQRFLTISPVEDSISAPPKVRIVQNWYEEFRDRE